MEGTIRRIADALLDDVAAEKRAQVRQLRRIGELVDASCVAGPAQLAGRERLIDSGADGTPQFAEFLILELAAMLGVGDVTAWRLIRDVMNLRYRHPRLWAALGRGEVRVWQARKIAARCAETGLRLEAALVVDRRLESAWGRQAWGRIQRRTEGLIVVADTALAAERAKIRQADRFVAVHHEGDGSSMLVARMNTADAVQLKNAVDAIANAMVLEGRTEALPVLRSEALADLARPTERGTLPRPEATLVVHVAREALPHETDGGGEGGAVAREDSIGPLLLDQVCELLAHGRVRLLPVLDLAGDLGVDAYEIPDRTRQQLQIREPFSIFPFSTTRSVHADLDHTIPYRVNGPPEQTRPSNLGPLGRREHRAKTFGGWKLSQPQPGVYRWRSPYGYEYEIAGGQTRRTAETGTSKGTGSIVEAYLADLIRAQPRPVYLERA